MKGGNAIISNLIILAVGIIFLFNYTRPDVLKWVIIVSGIMFIIPAIIYIFMLNNEAKKAHEGKESMSSSKRAVGWVCSIGAIILGAVMCIIPENFHTLYLYIFSIALFLGGCFHIYVLAKGMRPLMPPVWFYALPLILVIGSVVMFIGCLSHRVEYQHIAMLMTGIGLIVFAVTSFLEIISPRILKSNAVMTVEPTKAGVEDVEAEDLGETTDIQKYE